MSAEALISHKRRQFIRPMMWVQWYFQERADLATYVSVLAAGVTGDKSILSLELQLELEAHNE